MLLSTLLLSIVGGLLFTTRATFADDSHKVYEDCNGHVAFVSTGDLSRKWLGDWIIAPKVIPEKPTVLNVRLVEHKQSAWHGEQDIFHAKPVSHKDPKMIRIRLDYLALPYGYKLIISNAEYHLDPSFIVYDGYRKDIELTIATSRVRVQLLQTKYNPYNPKAYVYLRYSCIHSDHPDTLENYLPLTKCASVRWKGYMLLRELQCRPRFYGPINEVQCIWQDQICDGVKNCATGEDEEFCDPKRFNLLQGASLISLKDQTQLTDGHCEEGFFRCNVDDEPEEKSYCITNDWVCDGHNDCPGKRDEEREHCKIEPENDKCPKNTYFCSEDSVCLKMGVVCDKNVDCKGGIDESEEACTWRAERANKNLHTYNGTSDKSHLNRRRRSVAESVPVNVQDNSTDELADPMAILYLNKTQPVCNGIAVSQNVTSVWILFTNECKDEWNLENLTIQLGNNSELYEITSSRVVNPESESLQMTLMRITLRSPDAQINILPVGTYQNGPQKCGLVSKRSSEKAQHKRLARSCNGSYYKITPEQYGCFEKEHCAKEPQGGFLYCTGTTEKPEVVGTVSHIDVCASQPNVRPTTELFDNEMLQKVKESTE